MSEGLLQLQQQMRRQQAYNQLGGLAQGLLNYDPRVPQSFGRALGRGVAGLNAVPRTNPMQMKMLELQMQKLQADKVEQERLAAARKALKERLAGSTVTLPGHEGFINPDGTQQAPVADKQLRVGGDPELAALADINPTVAMQIKAQRDIAATKAGKLTDRQKRVKMLVDTGLDVRTARAIAAGRFVVSRNPQTQEAQIIDKGSGRVVFGQVGPEKAAAITSALDPDVDYSKGTGASGFFGSLYNTFTDLFSGKLGAPETEKAVQGLTNLSVRTQTALQDAVPGRPSNYLMQKLEQLAVNPKSLAMGDGRAAERVRQTRDMLKTELTRIENDILSQQGKFSRKDMNTARANASELRGILADYDVVLESFERAAVPPGVIDDETKRRMDEVLGR